MANRGRVSWLLGLSALGCTAFICYTMLQIALLGGQMVGQQQQPPRPVASTFQRSNSASSVQSCPPCTATLHEPSGEVPRPLESVVPQPLESNSIRRRPLHVFILAGIEGAFEIGFWLHQLIEHIHRPVILHPPGDSQIVEDSMLMGRNLNDVIKAARDSGVRNLGVFEWADETGTTGMRTLYPSLGFVLRQYYFEDMFTNPAMADHLVWVPNGYRDGVGPNGRESLLPATNRSMLCNFVGSAFKGSGGLRTDSRNKMMKVLEDLDNPCYVEYTDGFGGRKSPLEYSTMLRRSIFTLCPWGNSKETIRLYDAMECGSIPIMLRDAEFFVMLGDHPLPLISDWSELADLFAYYSKRPDELLKLQRSVVDFWDRLRASVIQNMDTTISRSFQKVHQCHDC